MATTVDGLTQATVTVSSSSTPISIIPPGFKFGGWVMRNRTASANAALVFAYVGTVPASAPPDTWELAPGNTLNDNIASASSGMDSGLSLGWAAVLPAAGASVIVDAMYR